MRIWLYNIQEIFKGKGFLVSPNLGTLGKPVFPIKPLKNAIFGIFDGNKLLDCLMFLAETTFSAKTIFKDTLQNKHYL